MIQRTFLYKLPNGLNVYQYAPKPRTPLKRSQKPIRKMSERKAKDGKIYTKIRKVYLAILNCALKKQTSKPIQHGLFITPNR